MVFSNASERRTRDFKGWIQIKEEYRDGDIFFGGGGYHERYSENVASMTFLDRKVAINPPAV